MLKIRKGENMDAEQCHRDIVDCVDNVIDVIERHVDKLTYEEDFYNALTDLEHIVVSSERSLKLSYQPQIIEERIAA